MINSEKPSAFQPSAYPPILYSLQPIHLSRFNLKTAVGREKAVQSIDVQRELKICVVTFWVMSQFSISSVRQGVVQTFVIQLPFLGLIY